MCLYLARGEILKDTTIHSFHINYWFLQSNFFQCQEAEFEYIVTLKLASCFCSLLTIRTSLILYNQVNINNRISEVYI